MTEIRITGNEEEVKRIIESIRPVIPEILEINQHDRSETTTSYYLTLMEPLQKDSVGQVQDWAIIEYCQEWRTTPQIKKYFKLEYEQTREICDRLYSQGVLARRLFDKSYGYLDRGKLHRCEDCQHFEPLATMDLSEDKKDYAVELGFKGKCAVLKVFIEDECTECRDFDSIQQKIDTEGGQ